MTATTINTGMAMRTCEMRARVSLELPVSCVRCTRCAPCAVLYTLYTHARALTPLRARLLVNALLCVHDTGETKSQKPELPQSETTVKATDDTSARVRVREKRGLGLQANHDKQKRSWCAASWALWKSAQ